MQKNIQVENSKKVAATAVLTGTFGMTIVDASKDNILVVEGNDKQWEAFDAANAAAGAVNSTDAWESLKIFGGIAKSAGIATLKGIGSGARGIIGFLGSDVTKTSLKEGVHVATKTVAVVGEVGATTVVATVNTLADESKAAYNRITADENFIGLKNKVSGLFTKKVSGLW